MHAADPRTRVPIRIQLQSNNWSRLFAHVTFSPTQLKGIANLEFASLGINAHTFKYKAGKTGVRAGDRAAVPGGLAALANPTSSPLLVYHYSKSVSEYASRTKTLGAGVSGATQKNIELYSLIDAKSNETCTAGAEAHARMTRRPTSLLMHVRDSSGEQEARR